MKFLALIATCAIMGAAGYLFYGGIIPPLLSPSGEQVSDPLLRTLQIEGENGETKEVTLDLNQILPTQYPQRVTLNKDIEVVSEDGSLSEMLIAGTVVIPRNVKDGKLIIELEDSSLRGLIPFSSSNFESQLALKIFAPTEAKTQAKPTSRQPPKRTATKKATPATATTSTTPQEVSPATPSPSQELSPAILAGTPSNIPKSGPLTEAQIIELMQRSVIANEVTEFTTKQVKHWNQQADETVDKEIFQVGLAAIEMETVYGKTNLQAKALVKNGSVVRWIWPRSGNNIR